MPRAETDWLSRAVLGAALAGLLGGLAASLTGAEGVARLAWIAGVIPALSMSAALAFDQTLAAAVVAIMYAGGTFLERFAEGRARAEMRALLERAPRAATRHRNGGLEEVSLADVRPGDRLLIRQGEVVPVDGTVATSDAFLDTAALTGESLPRRLPPGAEAQSGATNAGPAFDLIARRRAEDSTYAGIVRLVAQAQASKAPMSRLADRWALGFLALTLTLAGLAWWATGDPVRAVAVLVVATPCPLILAVPVALVAGLSRAARFGVLVKGGRALENLARVRRLVLDKTGTLTEGTPRILSIHPAAGLQGDAVLRLAAALDQASQHPVAQVLVAAARARGLDLPAPTAVQERPGEGLTGQVAGQAVAVGGDGFVAALIGHPLPPLGDIDAGAMSVAVALDGRLAGRMVLADPLRPGVGTLLQGLRRLGVQHIALATGDRPEVAQQVVRGLGLDAVHAGLSPEQKLDLVRAERALGPVMMVGDGINDAPALALADVGVAMGARGAAASAEAADVVLLVDRVERVGAGIRIAQAARRIALQSVAVGIGLSALGMVAAALGYLSPVQGALLQEAIDVAVILNALRALRIDPADRTV